MSVIVAVVNSRIRVWSPKDCASSRLLVVCCVILRVYGYDSPLGLLGWFLQADMQDTILVFHEGW